MTNTSSTGGRIIPTKTGLIHYGNTERFITEPEQPKKNGRPAKDEGVLQYSFDAFGSITIPQWTGPSQVVRF